MAKINSGTIANKIPRSQIIETGNIRLDYDQLEIEGLAHSIEFNGLLNPLTVKKLDIDENGLQTYELICGHRRIRAIDLLMERGIEYTSVECCIRSGNKEILQLIENIQRSDLSPIEKETAIKSMLEKGMTQKEISEALCKPLSWTSDILAGARVRELAETAGVETSGISSKAMAQLRSIPLEEIPEKINQLKEDGGTVKAATKILNKQKLDYPGPIKKELILVSKNEIHHIIEDIFKKHSSLKIPIDLLFEEFKWEIEDLKKCLKK